MYRDNLQVKNEIFWLWFTEWLSLREASIKYNKTSMGINKKIIFHCLDCKKIYNKDLGSCKDENCKGMIVEVKKDKRRSHPTISKYFNEYTQNDMLEKRKVPKAVVRKSKKGKPHNYRSILLRYRINLKFYFNYCNENKIPLTKLEKSIMNYLFEENGVRSELRKYHHQNIEAINKFLLRKIGEKINWDKLMIRDDGRLEKQIICNERLLKQSQPQGKSQRLGM